MNYYRVKELANDGKPTGLYHYTVTNDGRTYPVGYCADGCLGHATPDEASEHYRQYLLDTARFDRTLMRWSDCAVCGKATKHLATLYGAETYPLCEEHCNRTALAAWLPPVGDSISSY